MLRRVLHSLAALALLTPLAVLADANATSLEGGPSVSASSLPPPVGTGDNLLGTSWGVTFGARHALTNHLEVGVNGSWQAPVDYCHDDTSITTANGTFTGTLCSTTSRWTATGHARLVTGLVWRPFVGVDVGWSRRTFKKIDHIDVSGGGSARSFGLDLPDTTKNQLLIAPVAGLEWAMTDSISIVLAPRLEILLGGDANAYALTIPVLFVWNWYGLLD